MRHGPGKRRCGRRDGLRAAEDGDRLGSRGRWLVLVAHDVTSALRPQAITTDALEEVCRYVSRLPELWTDTVSAVGSHLLRARGLRPAGSSFCWTEIYLKARSRRTAAAIRDRWVKACGKLPRASPEEPIFSEYSPRWLA